MVQSTSGGFCVLNQFFTLPNQFNCSINQALCMLQGPFNSRHAIAPLFYFGANVVFERIGSVQPTRRFQFQKRGQLFIGAHDETLSVARIALESFLIARQSK